MEWDWGLEEVNPQFGGGFYRDLEGFDGVRAQLDFVLGFGIQNVAPWGFRDVGGWIEAAGSWSDYRLRKGADLDELAWCTGVGLALDRGHWAVSLRVAAQDPRDAGFGVDGQLAVRFWPDAAPLDRSATGPARVQQIVGGPANGHDSASGSIVGDRGQRSPWKVECPTSPASMRPGIKVLITALGVLVTVPDRGRGTRREQDRRGDRRTTDLLLPVS